MERPRPHGHAGHQVTAGFNRFEDRARPFSPHAVGPRVGAREGGRARRRLAPTQVGRSIPGVAYAGTDGRCVNPVL